MSNKLKLAICLTITLVTGFVGSIFTSQEISGWYTSIRKPLWNPPNAIFGPVWTILYILMGISLFLVWKSRHTSGKKNIAYLLFAVQLLLNFLWSFIFFRLHRIDLALLEILMLWISILGTIIAFSQLSKTAAWLLVPYISWVSFASFLNYHIWILNR